jgi:hypothetical protein
MEKFNSIKVWIVLILILICSLLITQRLYFIKNYTTPIFLSTNYFDTLNISFLFSQNKQLHLTSSNDEYYTSDASHLSIKNYIPDTPSKSRKLQSENEDTLTELNQSKKKRKSIRRRDRLHKHLGYSFVYNI